MIRQLRKAQQLKCDIFTAWAFFSSPLNLSKITPEDLHFNVLTKLPAAGIYEGLVIDYTVSPLLGIPVKWRTVITQVDEYKSFTDYQQKGPYKLWRHFHEFIPNDEGVLMKDTVDYELPLGLLGEIAYRLAVRKKLDAIFDYRHTVLDKLFNYQMHKI